MDTLKSSQEIQAFSTALAQGLSFTLEEKLGQTWQVRLAGDQRPPEQSVETVWLRITAEGGLQGECRVALNREQAVAFAAQWRGETASEVDPSPVEALIETISAAMPKLSGALLKNFGAVTFGVDNNAEEVSESPSSAWLEILDGEERRLFVRLEFSEALASSLARSTATMAAGAKNTAIDPSNLQLVMDVELNVSLRFGQCQLPLREVLDLTSGSVIELDRDVDDPVELLLDGKVIARGEAVIVDGNYGLRVTEIPEPIATHLGG